MRSITSADIEKWKLRRGATIAARTIHKELEGDRWIPRAQGRRCFGGR